MYPQLGKLVLKSAKQIMWVSVKHTHTQTYFHIFIWDPFEQISVTFCWRACVVVVVVWVCCVCVWVCLCVCGRGGGGVIKIFYHKMKSIANTIPTKYMAIICYMQFGNSNRVVSAWLTIFIQFSFILYSFNWLINRPIYQCQHEADYNDGESMNRRVLALHYWRKKNRSLMNDS